MNINELTIGQAKELAAMFGGNEKTKDSASFFEVGSCYLIRTVTYAQTGRVVAITDNELLLEDAAWIADTGRFHDALKNEEFSEVEPFVGPVIVNRGAIVDATPIEKLPRKQK